MIAIVNVTKDLPKPGLNDYEVRINREVICTFQHDRKDGLAVCLQKAAVAVHNHQDYSIGKFYDLFLNEKK